MSAIGGHAGTFSTLQLTEGLARLRASGTLVLRQPTGTRLLLLAEGEIRARFELGSPSPLAEAAGDFHFEPHEPADLPRLSCSHRDSPVAPLRALPAYCSAQAYHPAVTDLRSLLARWRDQAFSGAVTLSHQGAGGLLLLHHGLVGAAYFEQGGRVVERTAAMRSIYRFSLEASHPPLLARPLDAELARALLGLALECRDAEGQPERFDGIEAGPGGYTFYRHGNPFLQVAAAPLGPAGRFAAAATYPDLRLPDEPPGWEQRRFVLTLRGRDALNPMTQLSMEFGQAFGTPGRRMLEVLTRGHNVEQAAAQLGLELQEMKPWLERMERDGLIRARP